MIVHSYREIQMYVPFNIFQQDFIKAKDLIILTLTSGPNCFRWPQYGRSCDQACIHTSKATDRILLDC
jgi:hypothetical protein